MGRMVEIRALKPFRGRHGARLQHGDCQFVPDGFASVRVRLGDAEYVEPKAPVRKPVAPAERKVAQPTERRAEAREEAPAASEADEKDGLIAQLDSLGVAGFDRRYGVKRLRSELRKARLELGE